LGKIIRENYRRGVKEKISPTSPAFYWGREEGEGKKIRESNCFQAIRFTKKMPLLRRGLFQLVVKTKVKKGRSGVIPEMALTKQTGEKKIKRESGVGIFNREEGDRGGKGSV